MEGVVDGRLALGAAVIVVDRRPQALALHLRGEGHHGGGAAAGRRAGAAEEVVGHHRPVAGRLVEMAVGVDAARQHEAAARIDLLAPGGQPVAESGDPALAHADVGAEDVGGGRHRPAADHEIEARHHDLPLWAGRIGAPRRRHGAFMILNAKYLMSVLLTSLPVQLSRGYLRPVSSATRLLRM